ARVRLLFVPRLPLTAETSKVSQALPFRESVRPLARFSRLNTKPTCDQRLVGTASVETKWWVPLVSVIAIASRPWSRYTEYPRPFVSRDSASGHSGWLGPDGLTKSDPLRLRRE